MNFKNNENNNNLNKNDDSEKIIKSLSFLNDLTKDSFAYFVQDNTFIIFKSINNIFCLVYSSENKSLVIYNIIDLKSLSVIKNAHNNYITNLRYYLDEINNKDIILSISAQDNNLKLWNINNLECFLNINNIYNEGILSSANILKEKNQNYIILCNFNVWESEPIKIFDFKGKKINEIDDNINDKTFFIDAFYDIKISKNFIITGNWGYIKSYDFNKNIIYHKYCDNDKSTHYNIIINKNEEKIKLIEAGGDGNIRIWDFHTALLLSKIKIKIGIRGICLWNEQYLLVGLKEFIEVIDLKKMIEIKEINYPNYTFNTIKKILHPIYGECLISQGLKYEQIKLWKISIK